MFQHGGHRRVLQLGQFRLGHDAQRQHVDQHQEQQHGDEADHGGLAHVGAFFRPGREDARASMPMNTHTVTSIMLRTWFITLPSSGFSRPRCQR
jgi:hypothetical protein